MYSWCLLLVSLASVSGFVIQPHVSEIPTISSLYQPSSRTSSALSCICVDCKWVTSCKAYHFVESRHEQPHMTEDPDFEPRDGSPTIHVTVRTTRTEKDQEEEVQRMWKEHQAETKRAEEMAAERGVDIENAELHGETVYDLTPEITYEYDVVACEDFVEDKGCWVRNMPLEIKLANPDFVPT